MNVALPRLTRRRVRIGRPAGLLLAAALVAPLFIAVGGTQGIDVLPAGAATSSANSVQAFGSAAVVIPSSGPLPGPNIAITPTPSGFGYWTLASGGGVFTSGNAGFYGSMGATPLNQPMVGMASTPDGKGYWLVAADGGIFSFGDAAFYGSTGSMALNQPIVGMAPTPNGKGYWLVAADGGIFSFGDAAFYGSTGSMALNQPVVGMAATANGHGYWLVAADGGIFSFGDAGFYGSMGATPLNAPITAMARTADGGGYAMVGADGSVYTFGDAPFAGSGVGAPLNAPAVGIALRPAGYWIAYGQTASLSTALGQEETLAQLGYLPLGWDPVHGFYWKWIMPSQLTSLWVTGQYNTVLEGAIWAFEAEQGMNMDGQISGPEIDALLGAIGDPGPSMNPNGYTYSLALESDPETLSVWNNGALVGTSDVNTGISAAPTALGTYPVYLRLRNQIMTGTDPSGQPYADPVQFVAYFNGGDALHYMPRDSYGYPQSLGCVEEPYNMAATVWPYEYYGALVTVAP
jgi:hypothetical protein